MNRRNVSIVISLPSRLNPFTIRVMLNADGQASGTIFWDDGQSANVTKALPTMMVMMVMIMMMIA